MILTHAVTVIDRSREKVLGILHGDGGICGHLIENRGRQIQSHRGFTLALLSHLTHPAGEKGNGQKCKQTSENRNTVFLPNADDEFRRRVKRLGLLIPSGWR
jgi:hypothetical protein